MSQVGNRNVDVQMCKEPRTNEDAPMGSSLMRSYGKGRP